MRQVTLREFERSPPTVLSVGQRDALMRITSSITVQPVPGTTDQYWLTPGSTIGAVALEELSIIIRPKIPIDRVFFLLSYALDPKHWHQSQFAFDENESITEAIAISFAAQLQRAFRRGLIQGYRTEEASLTTVRGRIKFADQIRRRQGIAPPVETIFDDFTEDVLENQMLKAALQRLRRMRMRSAVVQRRLRHFDQQLAAVADVQFGRKEVPKVPYTRLNEHYRPAIQLAQIILSGCSLEHLHGERFGSAFLLDMNEVFENFVVTAVREALGLTSQQLVQNASGRDLHLDAARRISLAPDLTWWAANQCVFIGDVKYKRVNVAGIKNADIYQMLAYTLAAGLENGLLIYAAGEATAVQHDLPEAKKKISVTTVDVVGEPSEVLKSVRKVADQILNLRLANALIHTIV